MPAVTAAGSEVARLRLVSAAIDGRSRFLVIRFEREGEVRFARWIGDQEWRERSALHQLFAEAEPVASRLLLERRRLKLWRLHRSRLPPNLTTPLP